MISKKSTMPKVTVLMSVYNGERYLKEAIDSILTQTFTDFEFLIIDDASTDKTPDILRSYSDPRIRIVTNQENIGLTKSLNKGLELAKGEYVARMDADDISLPDRFMEEVNYLDSNLDVAVVGTGRENVDSEGNSLEVVFPPKIVSSELLLKGNQFQHSSVMFRKNIILKEGGYCESMQCCQDYYFWLKLAKKHQLHNIPIVLCKLRNQKDNVSFLKVHESALSHIFAMRIIHGTMCENEICYDLKKVQLTKEERIYYLNKLANKNRIDNHFREARKNYLEIFYTDPTNVVSLINYFRMFFGERFIMKTTNFYTFLCRIIEH